MSKIYMKRDMYPSLTCRIPNSLQKKVPIVWNLLPVCIALCRLLRCGTYRSLCCLSSIRLDTLGVHTLLYGCSHWLLFMLGHTNLGQMILKYSAGRGKFKSFRLTEMCHNLISLFIVLEQ